MVTTVTKTIGTGGDYSTLQSWEDACPANLISVDQIWRGEILNQTFTGTSGYILTISGQTTDSTRYIELTTASGASFIDNSNVRTNALRYNSSNGAAIETTAGYAAAIYVTTEYTRISKLQIKATDAHSTPIYWNANTGNIDQCICYNPNYYAMRVIPSFNGTGPGAIFRNCIFIVDAYAYCFQTYGASYLYFYNCTFVKSTTGTEGLTGLYTTNILKNCAIFGFTTPVKHNTDYMYMSSSSEYNATDATSFAAGTNNLTSLTISNQFISVANSTSGDWRTKSGANLIDSGKDLSSVGVTIDISNTSRSNTYDIGVWETISVIVSRIKPFIFRKIF